MWRTNSLHDEPKRQKKETIRWLVIKLHCVKYWSFCVPMTAFVFLGIFKVVLYINLIDFPGLFCLIHWCVLWIYLKMAKTEAKTRTRVSSTFVVFFCVFHSLYHGEKLCFPFPLRDSAIAHLIYPVRWSNLKITIRQRFGLVSSTFYVKCLSQHYIILNENYQ